MLGRILNDHTDQRFNSLSSRVKARKYYISDFSKIRRIRQGQSQYDSLLLFVKEKNMLRSVIDYRAFNRLTKPNYAPTLRTDKLFNRLGQAKYFSKLDLITSFYQIRLYAETIGKNKF